MLPLTAKQIPAVFQQARAAQAQKDWDNAARLYTQILAVQPNLAEVHFNLAQIAAARGQGAEALGSLKTAARLKPAEPAIWSAWIDLAQQLGARKVMTDIAKRLPKSGVPKPALAKLQARMGSVVETSEEKTLKAAVKANKSSAAAHGNYGSYLINHSRAAEAVPVLRRAVKLAPKVAQLRLSLGYAYFHTGALDDARRSFEKAEALGMVSEQLFVGLGRVTLSQKDDAAVGYFKRALEVGKPSIEMWMLYAAALRAARREDEAFAAYDKVLEMEPGLPAALAEKASLLQTIGQIDEARGLIVQALEREPENGSLYLLYASTGKAKADDPVMAKALELYEAGREDRHLAFAVSKVSDQPFAALVKANALSRAAFPYDFEADRRAIGAVRDAWARRNVKAWETAANPEIQPIFVTGMPRSGTTLVEQIIAAHSDVASAGEVGILGRYLRDVPQVPDVELIAQRYWGVLQSRFPGAAWITDKSIATYVNIGFIKAIMPNARIVVVRRDPRDNALSIFKNMFADGQHRYSNDLADIARFMRLFEEQVAFWEEAAPGSFTTIRYDDIIAEPEAQSRKLIADVGLDWQDACLSFYDNAARVDTLSNVQVRQPIYASSVGAWKRFEKELAPFLETYGPIL